MCRIVCFLSGEGGIGQTSLIYTLGKFVSKKRNKICLVDANFNFNSLSLKYNSEGAVDFKELVASGIGIDNILNNAGDYLWFVKTNSVLFDYTKHIHMFKEMISKLAEKMDYILIDAKINNNIVLDNLLQCSNEVFIFMKDEKESILKAFRIIQKVELYNNIRNVKIIVSRANIIKQSKGLCFNGNEIEKTLKREVLFVIPEFIKYNYFNYKNITNKHGKIIRGFCNAFITNKKYVLNYGKIYEGVFGLLRRKLHEKFE